MAITSKFYYFIILLFYLLIYFSIYFFNSFNLKDSFQVTPISNQINDNSNNNSNSTQSSNNQIVEHGLTSLSWSDCPFESPKLVVGGYNCCGTVWTHENNKWNLVK